MSMRHAKRKHKKYKSRNVSGIPGGQKPRSDPPYKITMYKGPSFFFTRVGTVLCYQKLAIVNNAGFTFANTRYEPTFAYDVDPTLGSTALPGFTELAQLYRLYRVQWFKLSATFSNLDTATTCTVFVCPSNVDPGNNSSTIQNLLSNPRCRDAQIGFGNGFGVSRKITINVGTDEFGGVVYTGQVDNYVGSSSGTAPTNNIFAAVGLVSTPALTSGVSVDVRIKVGIQFFELANPVTSIPVNKSMKVRPALVASQSSNTQL